MSKAGKSTVAVGKFKLECLSEELVEQAFEKARDESNLVDGRITRVTEAYYKRALNFMEQTYIKDEPIQKALGLQWGQEAEEIWLGVFRRNLSIMLIDENSGDVMGMRGISTTKVGDSFEGKKYENHVMKKYILMDHIHGKAKFFDYYGVSEAFHFLALGVGENYRNRGLASKLMNFSLIFLKHLQLDSICIQGECSSNYSKKVYEKYGFEPLYEQVYEDYRVDGNVVISDTGEHKSIKVYGKRI